MSRFIALAILVLCSISLGASYDQPNSRPLKDNEKHLAHKEKSIHHQEKHIPHNEKHLQQNKKHLPHNDKHLQQNAKHLQQNKKHLLHNEKHLQQNAKHLPENKKHLSHNAKHLQHSGKHLQHNVKHLQKHEKQIPHQDKHLSHNEKHKHYYTRENENVTCNASELQIFINSSLNIIAFLNDSSNISVVFDLSVEYILVLDGNNGTGYRINVNDSNPIPLENVWFANITFCSFLASLQGLDFNATEQVSNSSIEVPLETLIQNLGINNSTVLQSSFDLFENVSIGFIGWLFIECPCFPGGLSQFDSFLNQIITILHRIVIPIPFPIPPVSLNSFNDTSSNETNETNGTNVNLSPVLNAPNGIVAITAFLEIFRGSVNVSVSLAPYFESSASFIGLVAEFGGAIFNSTIDQYFRVIASIFSVSNNSSSLTVLFEELFSLQNGSLNLTGAELATPLQELINVLSEENSTQAEIIENLLKNLTDGSIYVNGVSLQTFFVALRNTSSNTTDVFASTVSLIWHLGPLFSPLQLYREYVQFVLSQILNSGRICRFIPGFNPQLLNGFNIPGLLSGGNFTQIPFIQNLLNRISAGVQAASNGTLTLPSIYNPIPTIWGGIGPVSIPHTLPGIQVFPTPPSLQPGIVIPPQTGGPNIIGGGFGFFGAIGQGSGETTNTTQETTTTATNTTIFYDSSPAATTTTTNTTTPTFYDSSPAATTTTTNTTTPTFYVSPPTATTIYGTIPDSDDKRRNKQSEKRHLHEKQAKHHNEKRGKYQGKKQAKHQNEKHAKQHNEKHAKQSESKHRNQINEKHIGYEKQKRVEHAQ